MALNVPKNVLYGLSATLCLMAVGGWEIINWTVNYHWVPPKNSLMLRYKGPPLPIPGLGTRPSADEGGFAKVDEKGAPLELGVLENMVGPGRHFYCPLWWECSLVPDIEILPGEVGLVTCSMGKEHPEGQYLVDGDLGDTKYKGTLRKVLSPGTYRVNKYGYSVKIIKTQEVRSGEQVKYSGWVDVPAGYVGVVTNLTDNPAAKKKSGIQDEVLQPGIYLINPEEQRVDIVFVGYREFTVEKSIKKDRNQNPMFEPSGEPIIEDDDSGVTFPSKDGFRISMDFTAIWGVWPDQAPDVVRQFGSIDAVEKKVVDPQIQSICRNMGSDLGAVELLVGESRQAFQEETSQRFQEILEEKNLTVLTGLVRNIYIPQQVRTPIQQTNIATELKLTRDQEQQTAKTQGLLNKAEGEVKAAAEKILAETEKLKASAMAESEKQAQETIAETSKLVAAIDKQTALAEAEATRLLGQATAESRKLTEEAKSAKFQLAVDAFGSPDAYNRWVFAQGLPENIQLDLIFAGDGTFWTDLKGFTETMLGKQAAQQSPQGTSNKRPTTPAKPTSGSVPAEKLSPQP
jgi:regulator of protease activity HflC (stomatin/prohibitin superfamily)